MIDRIQKEKDFHNIRFEQETRESLNKYYSINFLILKDFYDLLFSESKAKKVLEYGCGLGSQTFKLSKYAAHVDAIDISEVAISKAKLISIEKNISNITFEVVNAEELTFPNDYFDVAFGVSIVHHLDIKSFYSELSRVLRINGKAFFIEPLGHNPFINLFRKFTSNLRTEDEHPLLVKDLELLSDYFQHVNIKYYFFSSLLVIPFRNKKYFNKLLNIFNSFDQVLFKFQIFKKLAWQVIVEIKNPRK